MFNTGSDFFNVFMHIAAWAPTIPLCIVFFRKLYRQESFSLLMILCVVEILFNIFFSAIPPGSATYNFFNNIYYIAQFLMMSFLLRSCVQNLQVSNAFLFIMGLFVTVAITFNAIKGFNVDNRLMYSIASAILFLESSVVLIVILMFENKGMTLSPLFYIAAGIFFFYGLQGYLSFGRKFFFVNNLTDTQNVWKLIYIVSFIKYMFFTLAALLYKNPVTEKPLY